MIIHHDKFDRDAYQEAQDAHPQLKHLVSGGKFPASRSFLESLFVTFYSPAPRLINEDELYPSEQIMSKLLSEIMSTTQWSNVRQTGTVGDILYSAIATAMVGKSVLDSLDQKIAEKIQELSEAEEAAKRLFEEAELLKELADEAQDPQRLLDQAKCKTQEAEEQSQKIEELAKKIGASEEHLEDTARQSARSALSKAEESIEGTESALQAYANNGTTGDGKSAMTLKEKLQFANAVGKSEKLKRVAEITGRMKAIALRVQKTKVKQPPSEIVGITQGRDLGKILPSELVTLGDPTLEMVFFRKFTQGRLMQLDMRGREKQGRGPIIIVRDSSGSMADLIGESTTKEVWAKGVSLALLGIARKQKRDLAMVDFSNPGQLKTFEFPKGEASHKSLFTATEFFYSGGTHYEEWMRKCLSLVEESQYNKADVILVSDGLASVSRELEDNWNCCRKAREMRCYSVFLADGSFSQEGLRVLARISDSVCTIDDLRNDTEALETIFSV